MTEQKKKLIPIGIDDFEKLIKGDYYFVDKSLFIKELIDSGAEVTLIPRPRRFGKTLNLSMVQCFFENTTENARVYNPWSIINLLNWKGKLQPYWINTSDNVLIKKLLKLFCSYLTFHNLHQVDAEWFAELVIPNTEVGASYKTSFKQWFSEGVGGQDYNCMIDSLISDDIEPFMDIFTRLTHETLSTFDVRKDEPESFYHAHI